MPRSCSPPRVRGADERQMSQAGWGGTFLGGGIALVLLLSTGRVPPLVRRPNRRGRRVTMVPGVFPALAIVLVAAVRSVIHPETVPLVVVSLALVYGWAGLFAETVGGPAFGRRGLEVAGLGLVAEWAASLLAGAQIAPGVVGAVTAGALVASGAHVLRARWPPGVACATPVVGFLSLLFWGSASPMLETLAPGVAVAAILAPLDVRGRLVAGRSASGTLGACLGAVVASKAGAGARALGAILALVLAIARRGT